MPDHSALLRLPRPLARELTKALVAWEVHLDNVGQAPPTGWDQLRGALEHGNRATPLSLQEAADVAGVHPRTIRRWRDQGLPTVVHCGRPAVPLGDLLEWTAVRNRT